MPPRRMMNRQTETVPQTEQVNVAPIVPQTPETPRIEQGNTLRDMSDVTASPMEILLKRFQSFKPPTLKGTETSVECEGWLEDIEMMFDSLDYADDRRIRLIGYQLQDVAKSWRITTKKSLENQAENEEAKADQFINGLNPDVFTLMNAGRHNNFTDALD
ncbi:uncharacterized protein [Henckelia pumila]|uniref:uncharacterized protein n=1 Tax=Henckelia pumila TaxID=405737 RepID=UPI003C6DC04D